MKFKQQSRRLGQNFILDTLSKIGLDNTPSSNSKIKEYKLNIINLGTSKNPLPATSLEKQLFFYDSFRYSQVLNEQILMSEEDNYYSCISKFTTRSYGDYSYFAPFKINFNIDSTQFFNFVSNFDFVKTKNENYNAPFVRLNIPKELSNTVDITGTNSIYKSLEIQNTSASNTPVSGVINYTGRNTFLYTGISGYSGYLPYPQTVTSWAYPKYNIDSVIAINSIDIYDDDYLKDMNGLLIISTGNEVNQKIIYVSPHGISKITGYTVVETLKLQPDKYQPKNSNNISNFVYKKVVSGINVECLDIDSQYFDSETIFNSGIVISGDCCSQSAENFKLKHALSQDTPLKDTFFYKLYNQFYTKNKTLATGTWDGVIPANTNFVIEYLTCKNQYVGTENEFKIIYKNYGDNSEVDTNLKIGMMDQEKFNGYGFSLNKNKTDSIQNSNLALRRNLNHKYNRYAKNININFYSLTPITTSTPDGNIVETYPLIEAQPLLINNNKYNSFQKFISGLNSNV
jgi:hypothetical protein